MADRIDGEGISHSADLPAIAQRYFAITKNGNEWKFLCPFHADTNPSATLYQKDGKWRFKCFSCGEAHDAISFVMAVESCDFPTACRKITNGGNGAHPITPALRKAPPRITTKPPADCLPPPFATKQGEPSRIYYYLDADRESLGFAADYPDGRAYFTWGSRSPSDPPKWEKRGFNPAILFGLEALAAKPKARVIICHDEPAAEAASALFTGNPCVTWCGGDHAYADCDWTPILDRADAPILIARNDPAGEQIMARLAVHLYGLGLQEVKRINTDTYLQDDAIIEAPQGWSIADWEGCNNAIALEWAKPRMETYPRPADMPPVEPILNTPVEISSLLPDLPPELPPIESYAPTGEETPETQPTPLESPAITIPDALATSALQGWRTFGYSLTDKGAPIMSLDNALHALEADNHLKAHVWYDEFLDCIMTDWNGPARQWADADDVALCAYMQRYLGLNRLSVGQAHDAALMAAMHNRKNECKDWLNSLEWDGIDRLPHMLSDGFGTEHNAYTQAVGRCWMVSMVARVMRPGCKVDTVPVLEGEQGTFKSSALAILGGKWFIESHESVMSKDFFGVLDGHMIVEISEMHSFTRAEVERIKGVISCQVDRYRKAYGRNTEDHPRHTVLVCTTNRDDWQRDDTGARRFWPVRCGHISLDWLTANRENLFAEAVHRYKAGEAWWNVPGADQAQEADKRREVDSWEPAILSFITSRREITVGQILADCLNMDLADHDLITQRRVGRILRVNGWFATTIREPGIAPRRAWVKRSATTH